MFLPLKTQRCWALIDMEKMDPNRKERSCPQHSNSQDGAKRPDQGLLAYAAFHGRLLYATYGT